MKTLKKSSRGMALVLTLAFLALLGTLVVVFLFSSRSTRGITKGYATGVILQTLADSTLNLATSQITQATMDAARGSSTQATAIDPSKRYAWISQPGLIRTYTGSAAGPTGVRAYKLYSSDNMIFDGDWDPVAQLANEVPADWASQPARFTDLNEPMPNQAGVMIYPVVPALAVAGAMPGFSLNNNAAHLLNNNGLGVAMPVRWLYLLEDGTFSVADAAGKVTGATVSNPIRGRVAFWADDTSSQLNINTASGGTYWDIPRTMSNQDWSYSRTVPLVSEFQRFPGHPSSIDILSTIQAVEPTFDRNRIYAMTPRVEPNPDPDLDDPTKTVTLDKDRLYTTLDELAFKPDRTSSGLNQAQIQQLRFFLTSQSRSPDLNLFQQPRVTMWPIRFSSVNPQNNLIRFCSTIGGKLYAFLRGDGGNNYWNSRSPTRDALLANNLRMYSYLQRLTDATAPGNPGSLAAKYTSAERDQILTQMFDYIRAGILLRDLRYGNPFTGGESYTGRNDDGLLGLVTPSRIGTTQGFGRFTTFTEAALVIYGDKDPQGAVNFDRYQMLFALEPFVPSQGYLSINSYYRLRITGMSHLKVNGNSVYPNDVITVDFYGKLDQGVGVRDANFTGGHSGVWAFLAAAQKNPKLHVSNWFSLYSNPADPASAKLPLQFTQTGDITVELQAIATQTANLWANPATGTGTTVQSFTLRFPNPTGVWPTPQTIDVNDWGRSMESANECLIRSIEVDPASAYADYRVLAATPAIPVDVFKPFDLARYNSPTELRVHSLRGRNVSSIWGGGQGEYTAPIGGATLSGALLENFAYPASIAPNVPNGLNGAFMSNAAPGDWDTGTGVYPDGPYINKPDEGNTLWSHPSNYAPYYSMVYMDDSQSQTSIAAALTFTPNRYITSPILFGSLPTGVIRKQPWQTLLFSPVSAAQMSGNTHPGQANGSSPPDHAWLDLFTMPAVEPYALSEPFSTAGRINLNYQIAPFSHIIRTTALRAALDSVKVRAIPELVNYKGPWAGPGLVPRFSNETTHNVDLDKTQQLIAARFAANKPFISTGEITTIPLVPQGATSVSGFWSTRRLTGDNLREKPYADLYSKLTTQSNIYTIHMRVESLQKVPTSPADSFVAGRDQVTGEWRGSYTVERFIDPDDARFVGTDTAGTNPNIIDPDFEAVTPAYQWRTILSKRFQP